MILAPSHIKRAIQLHRPDRADMWMEHEPMELRLISPSETGQGQPWEIWAGLTCGVRRVEGDTTSEPIFDGKEFVLEMVWVPLVVEIEFPEITDEMVEAFKTLWERADREGKAGSRVRTALEGVRNIYTIAGED